MESEDPQDPAPDPLSRAGRARRSGEGLDSVLRHMREQARDRANESPRDEEGPQADTSRRKRG
ncbi:hypothetical protein [Ramlibacter humi]|uniref:Uncharacterized protein n=1 Tax=Ramlibacter humi TaxID=2530451 RepID=A0A4Z0BBW9_9BURK|nr:hypothetical protein [Ramlibacter humi]TFY96696.1 hypothetical protein EZ216_20140 [Ramlibacter humi]